MKAWLDKTGCLYIEGGSDLEDYALRMWFLNFGEGKPSKLCINLPNDDNKSVAPTIVRPPS